MHPSAMPKSLKSMHKTQSAPLRGAFPVKPALTQIELAHRASPRLTKGPCATSDRKEPDSSSGRRKFAPNLAYRRGTASAVQAKPANAAFENRSRQEPPANPIPLACSGPRIEAGTATRLDTPTLAERRKTTFHAAPLIGRSDSRAQTQALSGSHVRPRPAHPQPSRRRAHELRGHSYQRTSAM